MVGFFSSLFDPPGRLSFFGREVGIQPSLDDYAASEARRRDERSAASSAQSPGFSGDPLIFGSAPLLMPVVGNFGPLGGAGQEEDRPYWADIPGYPRTDPRMPFFVLPPNAIFNMPTITQLPGSPYVGKDGLPHLDGWNPYEGRVVSPGRGI